MTTINDMRCQLLSELKVALGIETPLDEFAILEAAIKKIEALQTGLELEHEDCVKAAQEVLPGKSMHFARQACWALVAEVRSLRDQVAASKRNSR